MRSPFLVLLPLCSVPLLLAGCPGDPNDQEATTGSTTAANGSSSTTGDETGPPATETGPPPDTETSPPPDTETDTAPGTETETDTGEVVPGCECILDEDPVDLCFTPADPTCGEATCPLVSGACMDGVCPDVPFVLDDSAALDCALTALAERTPGLVTWTYGEDSGYLTDYGYVLVNEDGTAVRRDWTREDLNIAVGDALVGELPPPEVFSACLADPDDLARFECMRGALETQLGVCDEGWASSECI